MARRMEQSRRHGHYDPRFLARVGEVKATPRSGRYELRDSDGNYAGTFVTTVQEWHVGDTFSTGDGRSLRITGIVPPELIEAAPERPRHEQWEVAPA
jgi:hypothetical protein